ncbi:hypothetical protein SAY86_007442 [Trapa natans]|uniref:Glutamine amidotransferase domain-containing protein n=1 Tax=Trapa natans TaxID=22666 RepID=A0AAN7LHD7_TRANT|nr:hypothetical protein SAY86_007442 [Trapa natans]
MHGQSDLTGKKLTGERWDLFRVVDGEFPEMAKLDKYHGFVVSGSPYDAYGDDYWILKLCSLLRILYAMEKKVLGVCFGHQVLCRALGGKVRKSSTGWDIGVRGVSIVKDCFLDDVMEVDGFEGQASVEIPKSLAIIECHQDEVSEVPAGAEIIAVSEKTGVEMFTFDGHVMGIQGHPEYTKDILCNLIDRLLNNGCIERDFAEDARSTLKVSEPNRKCWERICRNFLKGRLHTPAL